MGPHAARAGDAGQGQGQDRAALPEAVVRRIDAKILSLAHAPRPAEAVKLNGADALHRVRVGDYGIVELALDAATGRPRSWPMRTLHTATCPFRLDPFVPHVEC
mgnify:CR=1 FL=1